MTLALHTSTLTSLPLLARGKVRDNYAVGDDRILMIASDRLSAFDVIMAEPIPGKGIILTQMALFWFDKLGHICANHLTGDAPESVVTEAEKPQVTGGRSMLVKRLKPIPVEAVVRGYFAGSGWAEYQQSQSGCGVPLPAGPRHADKLPARIKASSMALYQAASSFAASKGIIIADTKFEFGLDSNGELVLMDEVLTPDSSRFWPVDGYAAALAAGKNPPSFDKQFLRDWLEAAMVDGKPWNKQAPSPQLPAEVIAGTVAKYQEALQKLTS